MSGPTVAAALQAVLPSPTQGVWHLGPFPLRAYALAIILGIVVAVQVGERRWAARGGEPGVVVDVAAWAVPFGIVGGRLYHVATSWQPYFGPDGDPVKALYIWEGGLGIWGAISLGALGAYIGLRRRGYRLPPFADAVAPGILAAQAIGRWGNWFNNELYGRPTDLPWALRIYEWDTSAGRAVLDEAGNPRVEGTFHPTFLYESLWCAVGVAVLLWADRRFRLGHGRVFALMLVIYTSGRLWIEALRVDDANRILGLRLNIWTATLVLVAALVWFLLSLRVRPGRERASELARSGAGPADDDAEAKDGEKAGAEAKDDGEKAEAKDDGEKAEAKDDGGKPEAKDDGGKPEAKDDGGKPEAKDDGGKPEAKDDGGKPEAKDDGDKPEAKAAKPEAEPAAKPEAEPAAKPKAEPAAKPKAEPAAKPKAEPAAKPKAEPAAKPKAEPDAKPEAGTAVEPTTTPTTAPGKSAAPDIAESDQPAR